jgi:streptomycin 6-kinase
MDNRQSVPESKRAIFFLKQLIQTDRVWGKVFKQGAVYTLCSKLCFCSKRIHKEFHLFLHSLHLNINTFAQTILNSKQPSVAWHLLCDGQPSKCTRIWTSNFSRLKQLIQTDRVWGKVFKQGAFYTLYSKLCFCSKRIHKEFHLFLHSLHLNINTFAQTLLNSKQPSVAWHLLCDGQPSKCTRI